MAKPLVYFNSGVSSSGLQFTISDGDPRQLGCVLHAVKPREEVEQVTRSGRLLAGIQAHGAEVRAAVVDELRRRCWSFTEVEPLRFLVLLIRQPTARSTSQVLITTLDASIQISLSRITRSAETNFNYDFCCCLSFSCFLP
jgi:hypothetical protein